MNTKALLAVIALLIILLACQSGASPEPVPAGNTTPQPVDGSSEPEIIIVMDISGSMGAYVLPSPAPTELSDLLDQIRVVENDPEIKQLEDQLDAILNQQEIKAAEEQVLQATYEWFNYIQDDLNIDLFDLTLDIQETLDLYNCSDYTAIEIQTEASLDEALAFLDRECPDLTQDERSGIAASIGFLDDEKVRELSQKVQTLNDGYEESIQATNYSDLDYRVGSLYADRGYFELIDQFDAAVQPLELPTRLDIAKTAASSVFDLVELDHRVSGQSQRVGLVLFSTYVHLDLPPTTDLQSARAIVEKLREQTNTNLGDGLKIALKSAKDSGHPTTIILLSDGWTNWGPSRVEIMEELSAQAKAQGTRICTVGFGTDEQDVDKELLSTLADASGGEYLFTSSASEVVGFFIACRQSALSQNVVSFHGQIDAGQTVSAGEFIVERNTGELTLSLNFINAELGLLITDPSGKQVDASYPGFNQLSSPGLELQKIADPEAGTWKVEVNSAGTGDEVGAYYVVISTTPGQESSNTSWIVAGGVLAAIVCIAAVFILGGGLIFYLSRRKNTT